MGGWRRCWWGAAGGSSGGGSGGDHGIAAASLAKQPTLPEACSCSLFIMNLGGGGLGWHGGASIVRLRQGSFGWRSATQIQTGYGWLAKGLRGQSATLKAGHLVADNSTPPVLKSTHFLTSYANSYTANTPIAPPRLGSLSSFPVLPPSSFFTSWRRAGFSPSGAHPQQTSPFARARSAASRMTAASRGPLLSR